MGTKTEILGLDADSGQSKPKNRILFRFKAKPLYAAHNALPFGICRPESPNPKPMINWDNLITAMKEDKVVLLLGPNLFSIQEDGKPSALHPYLSQAIQENHAKDLLAYYQEEDLFLFQKPAAKNESYFTLKNQLEKNPLSSHILENLMAIPIHLYLSFTPYLNPPRSFPKLEIPYFFHYGFYHKKRGAEDTPEPNGEQPLFYDMFGSIEEEESLILTHDDLFEYIRSIMGAKELHTTLKTVLQRARYFIFLGVPFEKWYVQLMLRLLSSINHQHSAYTWVKEKQDLSALSFLGNEFGIEIISDKTGAETFVQQLYERCDQQNLLRPDPSEGQGPYERIQQLLGKDLLEDAVNFMVDFLEDKEEDLFDDAMGLSARLSRLGRKAEQGIITQEEVEVGRNKLRLSLENINKQILEL